MRFMLILMQFDKLAAEQANLEAIIQAHDGHNLDNQLERAADALRLPDWDAKSNIYLVVNVVVSHFVAYYSKTRHVLIRRANQPLRCRIGSMVRAFSYMTTKVPLWRLPTTVTS